MQKQVFRHYDIRGKIDSHIAISDFYQITRSVISILQKEDQCTALALGRDGRQHSYAIAQEVIAACNDAGIEVYDLGVCSTPITMFAEYTLPVDGSLMITASHNPASYNGLKISYKKQAFFGEKLQQVYELCKENVFVKKEDKGFVLDASFVIDTYIESLATEFTDLQGDVFACIIDCGNGVTGPIIQRLISRMQWHGINLLCEEVDGTYPNHEADPTHYNNVQHLHEAVQGRQESFGIAFDGDGDRMAVISQEGLLQGDQLLTLFASHMLQKGEKFVCDIKASSVVQSGNAIPMFAATGCCNIKRMMQEHGIKLGGELSGHFFFKDQHPGYDDALYAMLRFLRILKKQHVSCDQLVATLPTVYSTGDIRIPCRDDYKHMIVQNITDYLQQLGEWELALVDGVRFAKEKSWGLIRAANTQPMLSICCEASTQAGLEIMKQEIQKLLQPYVNPLLLQQYVA